MDNLTHTLIGVAMARAGLSDRVGKGTTMVLAVSSNLPDLDVFLPYITGEPSWAIRRMVTHSVVTLPLLALLSATVFRFFLKNLSLLTLFLLALLGMTVHVFFDLVNSYGVVALWPFDRQRFELAWVFIIDLLIWAVLITPLIVTRFVRPTSSRRWYQGTLILLGVYLACCAASRWRSGQLLNDWIAHEHRSPSFTYLFPEALGAHRFRGVVKQGSDYTLVLTNTLRGNVTTIDTFESQEEDPSARRCQETELGKKVMWFTKARRPPSGWSATGFGKEDGYARGSRQWLNQGEAHVR